VLQPSKTIGNPYVSTEPGCAPYPAISTMAELKSGTSDLHRRLERRLASADRFTRLDRYIEHLGRLATFHVIAEESWSHLLQPVLHDFPARLKSGYLQHDLAYLNADACGSAEVPEIGDSASALGAFYVLEGATLGGQHLLRVVQRHLGLGAGCGASYLASYGPRGAAMWERFCQQVDDHCGDRESVTRAVAAARTTFVALEDCLCEESACRT
jgi:heme oxygenase (biliverdin-IX-beta and delta-forming)